jgi:hypothetical protein
MIDPLALKPIQSLALGQLLQTKRLMLMLPRQEGKTELGVRMIRSCLETNEPRACLFLAKNKESAKRMAAEKFMRLFGKQQFEVNTAQTYNRANRSAVCWMESVDKDPDRIRGGTYFFIHWAEVAFSKLELGVKVQDVFDKVIQPTLRKTNGFAYLESTSNGKNGWWEIWNDYRQYGFSRMCVSLSLMAELGLVSREEFDEIQRTTRPDVFRQEYECQFISFTGAVYNELIPDIHITDRIPAPQPWQQVCLSIDWGYTHATCVLFAYIRDGYICIFDEVYSPGLLLEAVHSLIAEKCNAWNIQRVAAVADHEPKSIAELNQRGIPCGNATKTNVLGNRMQIKELLFRNRLLIHPRCTNLIRDMQSATWDAKKPEEIDYSMCSWGHFDAEAALRYLVREYSGFEAQRPTELPRSHDAVSAAAWKLEFMREGILA